MKQRIETPHAPAPIGPYNQAIMVDDLCFLSGQIALSPVTGQMMQENIEQETTQVLENMKAVLQAAEMDMTNVVKCSIFITDMGQFAAINEVYGKYFTDVAPARETVQVAALPKGAQVEISCIAVKSTL